MTLDSHRMREDSLATRLPSEGILSSCIGTSSPSRISGYLADLGTITSMVHLRINRASRSSPAIFDTHSHPTPLSPLAAFDQSDGGWTEVTPSMVSDMKH